MNLPTADHEHGHPSLRGEALPSGLEAGTEPSRKPAVLGCWPLRRTVQVHLGTNPAVPRDDCPVRTDLAVLIGLFVHVIVTLIFFILGLLVINKALRS